LKQLNLFKIYFKERGVRYLLAGFINTLFGYFLGVFLYTQMIEHINILIISSLSNLIAITFAFVMYKIFVFRTKGNWLGEYLKCYIVYGGSAIFSIFLIWFLVEMLNINIWLAQLLTIFITVVSSYFGHKSFTFKVKDEKNN